MYVSVLPSRYSTYGLCLQMGALISVSEPLCISESRLRVFIVSPFTMVSWGAAQNSGKYLPARRVFNIPPASIGRLEWGIINKPSNLNLMHFILMIFVENLSAGEHWPSPLPLERASRFHHTCYIYNVGLWHLHIRGAFPCFMSNLTISCAWLEMLWISQYEKHEPSFVTLHYESGAVSVYLLLMMHARFSGFHLVYE